MEAAAAAVEDAKAAKAEKKSFSDQYKIVEMFDGKDIEGFLRRLKMVAYQWEWDPYLLDLAGDEEPPEHETLLQQARKKNLYTLITKACDARPEIFADIEVGDANGALKQIYRSFFRNTTGGYQDANQAFFAAKMDATGFDIVAFAAHITLKANRYAIAGGHPTEQDSR